jgi:hypothetical protein
MSKIGEFAKNQEFYKSTNKSAYFQPKKNYFSAQQNVI